MFTTVPFPSWTPRTPLIDGFYEVTTVTHNDTCSPATQQGVGQDLIQGTSAVVNVNLWSTLRQDIPWTDGEPVER